MPSASNDIILQTVQISKYFPGVKALDSVDVPIYAGKVNAIVGENGAGKSTLMKILSGVYSDYDGELYLDGEAITLKNPKEAQQRGIAIIHQELNLIPTMTVADNIFLGREFINRFGFVDVARQRSETEILLKKLKLEIDPATEVSQLRVGQQQLVEIAKALSLNARIIIMDEPTSAISDHDIDILFERINELIQQNVTIVYITHKLDEIFRIAHYITALRDGKKVDSRPLSGLTHDDIVRMMVGRDLNNFFTREHTVSAEILFQLKAISLQHPQRPDRHILHNVSLYIRRGEVVGLFGLMGAGRTELLETILGLFPGASGDIELNGRAIDFSSPERAIQHGIGFVPEDRKLDGLVLNMSVAQNTSLVSVKQIEKNGFLSSKKEKQLAEHFIDSLKIKTPSSGQPVQNLSGGNQQKVVLAKWLAIHPQVLLLDEPTRGIDINAKNEIYQLINELAGSGLGILVVSSELPEILAISDRIYVLAQGRITGEFSQDQASEEKLLKAAILSTV